MISVRRQSPDQPPNAKPGSGVARKVTNVPYSYTAEQVRPQSIPGGMLRTVPVPTPARAAVTTRRGRGDTTRLLLVSGSFAVGLFTVAAHWYVAYSLRATAVTPAVAPRGRLPRSRRMILSAAHAVCRHVPWLGVSDSISAS